VQLAGHELVSEEPKTRGISSSAEIESDGLRLSWEILAKVSAVNKFDTTLSAPQR
jgi:hypothetical protein